MGRKSKVDTDTNSWVFPITILCFWISFAITFAVTPNILKAVIASVGFLFFWNSVGLFITLVFSESLKPMPFYKKLIFSVCPFLYFSKKWRKWLLQEQSEKAF